MAGRSNRLPLIVEHAAAQVLDLSDQGPDGSLDHEQLDEGISGAFPGVLSDNFLLGNTGQDLVLGSGGNDHVILNGGNTALGLSIDDRDWVYANFSQFGWSLADADIDDDLDIFGLDAATDDDDAGSPTVPGPDHSPLGPDHTEAANSVAIVPDSSGLDAFAFSAPQVSEPSPTDSPQAGDMPGTASAISSSTVPSAYETAFEPSGASMAHEPVGHLPPETAPDLAQTDLTIPMPPPALFDV